MNEHVLKRLEDARYAGRLISQFLLERSEHEYLSDVQLRSSVERQLIVVGEALNGVRSEVPDVGETVPDIHRFIALRHLIVHEYGSIEDNQIWDIAINRVPTMVEQITRILAVANDETD